ncbi:hypothetical protein ACU4GD_20040 [Cupriavidus basilensis]
MPILAAWSSRRAGLPMAGDLLFSLTSAGTPVTDMSLGKIVRAALEGIAVRSRGHEPAHPSQHLPPAPSTRRSQSR